jgi:hypothetical protein
MQTELLYELYESCLQAIKDTNRALALSEDFHNRARQYAERLDMLLTDSVREQLADDITARMDTLIKGVVK